MDLLAPSLANFQLFLVCLARIGSLMATLPIFSASTVPAQLRLGLAVLLALAAFPVVSPYLPTADFAPFALGLLIAGEAMLGLMVGFTVRLIFTAIEFGGTLIGYQMGFAAANVFDPQTQHQVSVLAQFQNVVAILVFLSLDMHHLFFRAIIHSYALLQPGKLDFTGEAVPLMMGLAGNMFALGVRFSAPILALLLISGLVLGILARVFPQLNVFLLSYPINIGVGFLGVGLTLHLAVALLGKEFAALEQRLLELFATL